MQVKLGSKRVIDDIKLEKILAKQTFGDGWRYLVKWANISLEQSTWETENKLMTDFPKEYEAFEKKWNLDSEVKVVKKENEVTSIII